MSVPPPPPPSPSVDHPPTAHATAARAVDLRKVYGRGDATVEALRGVSVEFAAGEFTAIMGPSGSGKSTLLHCMAGLDTPTSGGVLIGDVDLTTLSEKALTSLRRDKVGFVFQAFNLIPTLTAGENITLPLDIAGRDVDRELVRPGGRHDRHPRAASAPSVRVVGGTTATGRGCSSSGEPPRDRVRRRADRQPGLPVGSGAARVPA